MNDFHCLYNLFWALLLGQIFHRFWNRFWLFFRFFWRHFSILFRHRFLVEFLMSFLSDFGRKCAPRKRSGGSPFSHFFPYFSRPRFWHRFGLIFYRFAVDFKFQLGSVSNKFRRISDDILIFSVMIFVRGVS